LRLSRRRLIAGPLAAALAAIAVSVALAQTSRSSTTPTRIEVAATPITAFDPRNVGQSRFGALEFRGGLVLSSTHKEFGGFSAIHVEPDGGGFVAVSDHGSWLRGRIVYRDGKPDSIADAEMAPLLGADGKPLKSRGWFDAESITERDGMLYVGLERVEQIVRFNYRRDGLLARGEPIPVPPDFKTLTQNKSLECLAAAPKDSGLAGSLIVVTEHSLDAAGNFRGFLLNGPEATRFSVKRSGDYDASDCAVSKGDLLLLERSFSIFRGLGMRIRRVPLAAIKPDAVADGPVLIEADLGFEIDNMEGIAVHRDAQGDTIITLISDDNFLPFQRTLLLQFAVVGE
jgi:hypothetical protein